MISTTMVWRRLFIPILLHQSEGTAVFSFISFIPLLSPVRDQHLLTAFSSILSSQQPPCEVESGSSSPSTFPWQRGNLNLSLPDPSLMLSPSHHSGAREIFATAVFLTVLLLERWCLSGCIRKDNFLMLLFLSEVLQLNECVLVPVLYLHSIL